LKEIAKKEFAWLYKNPPSKKIAKWRRKKIGSHIVNLAILKNGKSVSTSVWHPKTERKSANKQVQRVLNRIHKK